MVRDIVGAQPAEPTGWCSWQGLVTLPDIADKHVALMSSASTETSACGRQAAPKCSGGSTCRGRPTSSGRNVRST